MKPSFSQGDDLSSHFLACILSLNLEVRGKRFIRRIGPELPEGVSCQTGSDQSYSESRGKKHGDLLTSYESNRRHVSIRTLPPVFILSPHCPPLPARFSQAAADLPETLHLEPFLPDRIVRADEQSLQDLLVSWNSPIPKRPRLGSRSPRLFSERHHAHPFPGQLQYRRLPWPS